MNFCGLRLGSALIGFFGRDPGLFPPPRPAPACRVVVAEKSLSGRLSQQKKKKKSVGAGGVALSGAARDSNKKQQQEKEVWQDRFAFKRANSW